MDRKIAIVTGATQGIGLAVARTLEKEGYFVIGTYISHYHADFIKSVQTEYFVLEQVDVSQYDAVEKFAKMVKSEYGSISCLINNAGIVKDNLIMMMDEKEFDAVMDVNLKGSFNMVKHFSRQLLGSKSGSVVNISSVIGEIGNIGQSNYAASKAGLVGFSKSLAKEFALRNVRVNCVSPGFIQTEMTAKLDDHIKENILKNISLKRFGDIQDVANAVKFLVSDDAKYITGQTINVCGGLVI